jgi:hypothetical protein
VAEQLSELANILDGYVEAYTFAGVIEALAELAERDTTKALELHRDRVKASRLASTRRDLVAMAKNLKGHL